MILAIKIVKHDLEYVDDMRECLLHNSSIPDIEKIFIFSDQEISGIDIDKKSRKIVWMKIPMSHLDSIKWASKYSSGCIIYSTPFVKFDSAIRNMAEICRSGKIFRSQDSYYMFWKNTNLMNAHNIDDILGGSFQNSTYPFVKMGYFSNKSFPVQSIGWKICRIESSKSLDIANQPNISENIVKESRIDVVIVSVNYNDFLEITLKHNTQIFDSIFVVTSTSDEKCQEICQRMGVRTLVTDCMYSDGAKFNKGKAINHAIASIKDPDLILILDADIIVTERIDISKIENGTIYYKDRIILDSAKSYDRFLKGDSKFRIDSQGPLGYFHLFRYDKRIKYLETCKDASWIDIKFASKFKHKVKIGNPAIHLGQEGKNWSGRITPEFVYKGALEDEQKDLPAKSKSKYTICSYYFNFRNDVRQKKNFISFLEQFKGRYDEMIVGLVDYGDLDFEVPCRKLVVKGNPKNKIWSKEYLINQIVDSVDTEYIAWIDGDIIYDSLDWLDNIEEFAKEKDFVQLFENIRYLDDSGNILENRRSLASYKIDPISRKNIDRLLGKGYNPGVAWLSRTSILKEKKLFDKMYVGGGDTIMAYALYSVRNGWTLDRVRENNESIYSGALDWISGFGSYRVGFLKEDVSHLYHGDLKDRNYDSRYKALKKIDLDNKKIVVYTCISGCYDILKEVACPEKGIDYICFTDQEIESETWTIVPIPEYLKFFGQVKAARCLKILPHLFLDSYDISLWVDGSIEVMGDIKAFISENLKGYFAIPKHPDRICVYQEAEAVISMNKDSEEVVSAQIEKYRRLGYPERFGMVQSNVIIRHHSNPRCVEIGESWWKELSLGSRRDQLSFNFSIWNKEVDIDIMLPSVVSSEYMNIWTHVERGSKRTKLRKDYDQIKNYINGKEV